MKTTSENLINSILENGVITEKEIKLICRRLNAGEQIDLSKIWDNPIKLTSEQNKKGIDYLLNQWKTPNGKERISSPYGYREENILENFTHFTFDGVYNASRYREHEYYIPLYSVHSIDNCFQYHFSGGKVNIVG